MEPSSHESAETLAARADLVRARLSATLLALRRRRHDVLDLRIQFARHAGFVAIVAGACVVGTLTFGVYRMVTAASRRRRERWRLLRRVWEHPERVSAGRTMVGKIARVVLVSVARAVVTRVLAEVARAGNDGPAALGSGSVSPHQSAQEASRG